MAKSMLAELAALAQQYPEANIAQVGAPWGLGVERGGGCHLGFGFLGF